jgi:hypothetical protein
MGGCDHYGVSATSSDISTLPAPLPGTPAGAAPPAAYDPAVTTGDLYTYVWVEAHGPTTGSPITACSDNLYSAIFRSRTRAITISADITPTTSIPLYAVTQNGSASCAIRYQQIFLSPRQVLDPTLPYEITGSAIVDDSGNQRISEYLQTAAAFATLIAPLAPQAGVVAAGINVALQSDSGKKLSDETNSFASSKIGISGLPLVSLQPPQTSKWFEQSSNYKMTLQRYNYANQPYNEPPSDLGTMTIHVYRTVTIFVGGDPIANGTLGGLPTYDNLGRQTKVFTITSNGVAGSGIYIPNSVKCIRFLKSIRAHRGRACKFASGRYAYSSDGGLWQLEERNTKSRDI